MQPASPSPRCWSPPFASATARTAAEGTLAAHGYAVAELVSLGLPGSRADAAPLSWVLPGLWPGLAGAADRCRRPVPPTGAADRWDDAVAAGRWTLRVTDAGGCVAPLKRQWT